MAGVTTTDMGVFGDGEKGGVRHGFPLQMRVRDLFRQD